MEVNEKIHTFFSKYKKIEFAPKKIIIRASEEIQNIYFIENGNVRMYLNVEGQEINLHPFGAGSYFPVMLVLGEVPNRFCFETLDSVVAYKAPIQDVLDFIKSDEDVCHELLVRFAKGMSKLLLKPETSYFKDSYSKVINILVFLAEKFGKEEGAMVTIDVKLSHQDIASWAGMQRETASRQLELLSKKGLIQNNRLSFTVNIEALKSELRA